MFGTIGTFVAIVAAFGSAICFGVSIVLEQIGAKKISQTKSLNPMQFIAFTKEWQYSLGLAIDFLGWLLLLVAVRRLPLFLAQSIVASCLVVTVLIERYYFKVAITNKMRNAILLIVAGLFLLAYVAVPGTARVPDQHLRLLIVLSCLPVIVMALLVLNVKSRPQRAALIACVAGIAFSVAATIERVVPLSHHHILHTLTHPLIGTLLVVGGIGMLLFSKALQEGNATTVNGTVFATQVVASTILGVSLLGDPIKHGLWPLLVLGCGCILGGTIGLLRSNPTLE